MTLDKYVVGQWCTVIDGMVLFQHFIYSSSCFSSLTEDFGCGCWESGHELNVAMPVDPYK